MAKRKKMTTDKIWSECLRMWDDIYWVLNDCQCKDEEVGIDLIIMVLKCMWMKQNGYSDIECDCFFCREQYRLDGDINYPNEQGSCAHCPGTQVDKNFACDLRGTSWRENPFEFRDWLHKLDRKRQRQRRKAK